MAKGRLLFFFLGTAVFFLFAVSLQTNVGQSTSSDTLPSPSLPSGPPSAFAVCPGTFALCTEAVCDPVIKTVDGRKRIEFSCSCKVQVGYSVGANVPNVNKGGNPCKSVPKDPPAVGQRIPSRYAPIKSYVACRNNRPWAMCLDSPCVVDHVDKSDPTKGTASCACKVLTGSPYVYIPPDGKYSQKGCDQEYISSATVEDALQVTEFLTTPAGKDLPPTLPVVLVPTPTPTPTPAR
jgi:hypothetical protein